jgi:hypothetical protein
MASATPAPAGRSTCKHPGCTEPATPRTARAVLPNIAKDAATPHISLAGAPPTGRRTGQNFQPARHRQPGDDGQGDRRRTTARPARRRSRLPSPGAEPETNGRIGRGSS